MAKKAQLKKSAVMPAEEQLDMTSL